MPNSASNPLYTGTKTALMNSSTDSIKVKVNDRTTLHAKGVRASKRSDTLEEYHEKTHLNMDGKLSNIARGVKHATGRMSWDSATAQQAVDMVSPELGGDFKETEEEKQWREQQQCLFPPL